MNMEDNIRTVFAVPLGFLLGLILSAVTDLFAIGYWKVALIILGAIVLFLLFQRVSDAVSLRTMEKLSDRSEAELREIRERKLVGNHSRIPRYVFVASAGLGYLATFIWPATDILQLFT